MTHLVLKAVKKEVLWRCILVFPPFLSKFRYIAHQFVKEYFPALASFSVGLEEKRRLVLGFAAFVNSCCLPYRCVHEKLIHVTKVENNLDCACHSEYATKQVKSKKPFGKSINIMKIKKMNPDDSHKEEMLSQKNTSLRDRHKRPDKQIYVPRALRGFKNNNTMQDKCEADIVRTESLSEIELLDQSLKSESKNLDEKVDNLNQLITNSETVLSNTKQNMKKTGMPMLTSNVELQIMDNDTTLCMDSDSFINANTSKSTTNSRTSDSCASSSSMLNTSSEGETSNYIDEKSTDQIQDLSTKCVSKNNTLSSYNESKCSSAEDVSNTDPVTVKKDEFNQSNDEESWESMFNDDGECLNPDVVKELSAVVGRVKIKVSEKNYSEYQPISESNPEFDCLVELYDFPKEFSTQDLVSALSFFQQSSYTIKWVDDCHALALFTSPAMANQALQLKHTFVKIRPLSEGIKESKAKARFLIKEPEPSKPRPTTSAVLARRLVTGALGLKVQTSREQRERERSILKEAKEKRKLEAKQRQDIWDGVV